MIVGARLEGTLEDWRGVDDALGMLVGISSNSKSSFAALRLGAERWSRTRFFGAEASALGFLMVNLPLLGIPLIMSDIESLPPPVLTRAHTLRSGTNNGQSKQNYRKILRRHSCRPETAGMLLRGVCCAEPAGTCMDLPLSASPCKSSRCNPITSLRFFNVCQVSHE